MDEPHANKEVVITGDITMDWNLARMRRSKSAQSSWQSDDTTCSYWQRGGAALVADLVAAVSQDLQQGGQPPFVIHQTAAPQDSGPVDPDDHKFHQLYAMWAQYKYDDKPAWRVEEFMGLDRAAAHSAQDWEKVVGDTPAADLVVLIDSGLGFRQHPELWPMALDRRGDSRPWVILKMARPLAQGALWDHLHRECSDRLIVTATVDDLRLSEVQISRELSWERTAQDVYWELVHNPCVNSLSHCAHLVVSFGPAGAILLSRSEEAGRPPLKCSLFFDPKVIERMWERAYPGGMVGYHTCLVAGLARQVMLSPEKPDIDAGIQAGLAAMRNLHRDGFGQRGTSASEAQLVFPISRIATVLAQTTQQFAVAEVREPLRTIHGKVEAGKPEAEEYWTILEDRVAGGLEDLGMQIVLQGAEVALQGVPWGQFGNLLTVDRQEIESYRNIRNLVAEYAGQEHAPRPLSIAVFGSPGSGKSFGVTEVAKALLPGQIETMTFNLSQFDSIDNLLAALHQVRDVVLSGRLPLVFWDEFDTPLGGTPLGWLRYFLAPMQDGRFQQGQVSHPIGRSIFIFAGGTSSTMMEFDRGPEPAFRAAKGPDFVSRLRGYINVLGPNPVKEQGGDPYFIIRRAILLRSSLWRMAPQLFEKRASVEWLNIDRGVLRALLKIGQYKHGARSLESLLAMSQLTGKTDFERSCLPSESQLNLHVDGRLFLSLVQQVELEGQVLETLAEAAHDLFCERMHARGYRYGPLTDTKLKTHDALLGFDGLPEELRARNRQSVRDIPRKLELAGYIMIPARSHEAPFHFPAEALEMLAEAEHERWRQSKLDDGWAYGATTDKARKLNECLVPWEKLGEEQKNRDRDLVRGIPQILARAGYAIVQATPILRPRHGQGRRATPVHGAVTELSWSDSKERV